MEEAGFFEQALREFFDYINRIKRFIDSSNPSEAGNDIRYADTEVKSLEVDNPFRAQSIGVRDTLSMAEQALGGYTLESQDNLRRAREHWESAAQKAKRPQDIDWVAGHVSEVQKRWKAKLNVLNQDIEDRIKEGSQKALKDAETKIHIAKDEDPTNSAFNWDALLSKVRELSGEKPSPDPVKSDFEFIKSRIESLMQRGLIQFVPEWIKTAWKLADDAAKDFKSDEELVKAAKSLRNQAALIRENFERSLNMEAEGFEALKKGNLPQARSNYANALGNIAETSPRYKDIKIRLNNVEEAVKLVEQSARDEAAGMLSVAIKNLAQAKTSLGAPWVEIPWFDEALTRLEGKQRLKDLEAKLEAAEFNLNVDSLRSVLNMLQQVEAHPGIDMTTVKTHWQRYRTLRDTLVSAVLQQARSEEKNANLEQSIELISRVLPLYTEEEFASVGYQGLETQRGQWQQRLEELGQLLQSGRGMLAEGNWEGAATYYGRALEVVPNRLEAMEGLEVARGLQHAKLILHDHPDRHQLNAMVKNIRRWASLARFHDLFAEKPNFSDLFKEAEQALKRANRRLWKLTGIFSGVGVVVVAVIASSLISLNINLNVPVSCSSRPTITPPPVAPTPAPVERPKATLPLPDEAPNFDVIPSPDIVRTGGDKKSIEIFSRDGRSSYKLENFPSGARFRDAYVWLWNEAEKGKIEKLGYFEGYSPDKRFEDVLNSPIYKHYELKFEKARLVWYATLEGIVVLPR